MDMVGRRWDFAAPAALLIRPWIMGWDFMMVAATGFREPSMSVRSHLWKLGVCFMVESLFRVSMRLVDADSLMSRKTTLEPCWAKWVTSEAPMPWAPPEMTMTRSSRLG